MKEKTKDDMELFAKQVYLLNEDYFRKKEAYYDNSEYVDVYPFLKVGDLIKVQSDLKQGKFGIFLDEYSKLDDAGKSIKQYVVLTVNNDGNGINWKVYSENELKFTNPATKNEEFVIRKKLQNVVDEVTLDSDDNTIYHIKQPFSINAKKGNRLPSDLIRLLKKRR